MSGDAIELYWIPLGAGAGGGFVRWSGRIYEAIAARRTGRQRQDLYHSALIVTVDGAQTAIEMAPVWTTRGERGVVAEGPVGARILGRSKLFRYEIRRWTAGSIPDAAAAIDGPRTISTRPETARTILELVPTFPTLVWGRDNLQTGDMWNSNSLVSWVLVRAELNIANIGPPPRGRAPGWDAGIIAASRTSTRAH